MTDVQRRHTAQTTTGGPVVWILSKGEMYEGGTIVGVFLDRDLARGAFTTEAQTIQNTFSIDNIEQCDDGAIRVEGGCDWVDLVPHTVVTAHAIDA
ncbi:hypothetical protein [Streptomyces scopuliridis]|uniref:hypothetical protein n=1 Tax=Streptomyces scopuliridis TaxID=452529 RepID=UPI00343A4FC2